MIAYTIIDLLRKLRNNNSGSVVVEFSLYSVAFFVICTFLVDWGGVLLDKSQIARANASLASVLRERTLFYDGEKKLTQKEVNTLYQLAGVLFADSRLANRNYMIAVDTVFFTASNMLKVKDVSSFRVGDTSCNVQAPDPRSQNITSLSVLSTEDTRWQPLYQVTICVKGSNNLFKKFDNIIGETFKDISISNAVIAR